ALLVILMAISLTMTVSLVATISWADELTSTCVKCHDNHAASLENGPHRSLVKDPGTQEAHVSCLDCHTGLAQHWTNYPLEFSMTSPTDNDDFTLATNCASCHTSVHQENQQTLSLHAEAGVSCLSCHQIHGGGQKQLIKPEPQLCYTCHADQKIDFAMPSRHPVGEGIMNCSDCHLATADNMAPLGRLGKDEACFSCHAEYRGPFPYEHEATVDWSTEEGGCINCHDPHGSALPQLLIQPYEAPHFQLCSQCHIVPKHNYNSFHGTDWAGVSCAECHSEVHGSYTSRLYLTPTLEAQGCFVAGCHSQ
ncbi:MAG: DmsE family decaheme c-type cytochrome, partial [Candidatus Krumholzibacteriia bacterium]